MVKNLPANARRHKRRGFDLWVGKVPPEEGGSCLENPMDRRAWQAIVLRVHRFRHD